MHMLRLIPACMLFVSLAAQVTLLPGQANAINCCPCFNPCKAGCVCRGTVPHCPTCRAGGPDLFQSQAVAISPVSDFGESYEAPSFIVPAVAFSNEFIGLMSRSNRTIGDQSLRFLNSEQFAFKFWCPV